MKKPQINVSLKDKAKIYQKKLWKQVDLKELNKFLKTHNISTDKLENEIICNQERLIR